jgi:hypothetical protein
MFSAFYVEVGDSSSQKDLQTRLIDVSALF